MRNKMTIAVLALMTVVAIFAARKQNVSYPYTDVTTRYLTDAGSYSEDNTVHLEFNRIIVPDSAPVFVDYRLLTSTSSDDWSTYLETTFSALSLPYDFQFNDATNYSWMVYTTWTPGPAVVTNGVWHAFWGLSPDGKIIPVNSTINDRGEIIAPPKEVIR